MADGTTTDPYALAEEAAQAVRERFGIDGIDVSFTLGSGWAAASDDLGEEIGSCPLEDLPGFSAPVADHRW
jgi:purine-nucleoside phosphorylase